MDSSEIVISLFIGFSYRSPEMGSRRPAHLVAEHKTHFGTRKKRFCLMFAEIACKVNRKGPL